MQDFLRKKVKEIRPLFIKGGKYEKYYPLYEAHETLFFQPDHAVGSKGAHIRDAADMKRTMVTVILALLPLGSILSVDTSAFVHPPVT